MHGNISNEQAAACLEGAYYAAMGIIQLNHGPGKKHWCMVQPVQSVQPMFSF